MHLISTRIAATALVAALAQQRAQGPSMGGFEQKNYNRGGARLALKVNSGSMTAQALADLCKEDGRSGVIYCLPGGRMEVVAEGEEDTLKELVDAISSQAGGASHVNANWQLPLGSYQATFPVVDMSPDNLSADIELNGAEGTLDYMARHVQIEAVFNRGLKVLKKDRVNTSQLRLSVKGQTGRLKSFVRWCYNGPPMERPEEVTVKWQ